jgi:hypothetical protein
MSTVAEAISQGRRGLRQEIGVLAGEGTEGSLARAPACRKYMWLCLLHLSDAPRAPMWIKVGRQTVLGARLEMLSETRYFMK